MTDKRPVPFGGFASYFLILLAASFAVGGCAGEAPGDDALSSSDVQSDGGESRDGASADAEEAAAKGPSALECFPAFAPDILNWSYDHLNPVIGSHCTGTNHQDISGIEKVVFLGDSITQGTFPTSQSRFYKNVLLAQLEEEFGTLDVDDCAGSGAMVGDLVGGQKQIARCFPGVEEKKTLVIMTLGGNNVQSYAFSKTPASQVIPAVDSFMADFRTGIQFFDDPSVFPNGVYVIFANVYEFTDGTANLGACTALRGFGLSGVWADGIQVFGHLADKFLEIAVDTNRDMIFMAENFCGHGFMASDTDSPCYGQTDGEVWFGNDCIHPNVKGHAAIAQMFFNVVME